MKRSTKPKRTSAKLPRGFALVVSLTMLVLLTVIAVGLLSLSAITLRTSTQSAAQAEAQANARLALMIAVGELQKQLGPDQRITANSDILSDATVQNPQWTGVWNSWRAGPSSDESGYPSDPSDHQTIPGERSIRNGMHPTYTANRGDHFRSWLLSLNPGEASDVNTPRSLALAGERMPRSSSQAVILVGQGSLGSAATTGLVSARLLPVKDQNSPTIRGRYGWWVGDESQKARIMNDSHDTDPSTTVASRLFRQQAPGSMGTNTIVGLENVANSNQLSALPSLLTVGLLEGATPQAARNFHSVTPYSFSVLADVREGGLKRDLNTLLERTINVSENSSDFMLYKFDVKDGWSGGAPIQEAVPIQDLAAYYQLYDGDRAGWKQGTIYSSNLIQNGLQIQTPYYGGNSQSDMTFFREYTNLYRQPVPVKVQFILSVYADPIVPAPVPNRANPNPNTHKLIMGITPSVTLWNPTNLPMVMQFDGDNPRVFSTMMRMGALPLRISMNKNDGEFVSDPQNLTWYAYGGGGGKAHIFNLYFSGLRPIRFEPGEVKTFSLPYAGDASGVKQHGSGHINMYRDEYLFKTDKFFAGHEVVPGWDPEAFVFFNRTASRKGSVAPTHPNFATVSEYNSHVSDDFRLLFKASDRISFNITADNPVLPSGDIGDGYAIAWQFIQNNHQSYTQYGGSGMWGNRHYKFRSREGTGAAQVSFNEQFMSLGFPGGNSLIEVAPRSGSNIIVRSQEDEGWSFLQFSLQAGVETHESSNGGVAGGRKFANRPFLHSSSLAGQYVHDITGNAAYNHGWNWSVDPINEIFEAPVQTNADNQGFYGGGYTPEYGTNHIVQQEIPVVPPIAIASLSHAHLGGFSISEETATNADKNTRLTAVGGGGLAPFTLQAIGNSYAHPLIPAGAAYTEDRHTYDSREGARPVTLADHSYLANKALWDEFFFSSLSPQPSSVRTFGQSGNLDPKQVATRFFFGNERLPNRRYVAYDRTMDEDRLDELFTQSSDFRNGLADKIAAYLVLEGPFNINSTSVDAWRTMLSSLKGKPVTYLDKGKALNGVTRPDTANTSGTPVSAFTMPNAEPGNASNDPRDPEQWLGWRELTDDEMDELAEAIVRQIKRRGPFLSLSEFVNRRLDSSNPELAAKGALQSALDDTDVSINAGFRNATRQLGAEASAMSAEFSKALDGPVAYGSSAYVDQADLLRNFAAQLTPRGDTFVIRTYGDSLDKSGKVVARAWCEAVVQRVPEYFDPVDDAHVPQSELSSQANRNFGRKLEIVSFRWLNSEEV